MKSKTEEYFFDLPEELIALEPLTERDQCKLLVIDKNKKKYCEKIFFQLIDYLTDDDLMVFNNTKVDKSRVLAERETGGRHEVLLLSTKDLINWEAITQKTKKIKEGAKITLVNGIKGIIKKNYNNGRLLIQFEKPIDENVMGKIGQIPLPPYIQKKRKYKKDDEINYQTIYSEHYGAKASPTAGLHFTHSLMDKIKGKGIETAYIQLNISQGTFEPVKTKYIDDHLMHKEEYFIPDDTAKKINDFLQQKKRIIAVGTTVVRTLESAFNGKIVASGHGETNIYIIPGYQFKVINALVTNFHTPKSTLLMLVSAFIGKDFLFDMYNFAITNKYRFFSYGDAMLIF